MDHYNGPYYFKEKGYLSLHKRVIGTTEGVGEGFIPNVATKCHQKGIGSGTWYDEDQMYYAT